MSNLNVNVLGIVCQLMHYFTGKQELAYFQNSENNIFNLARGHRARGDANS